MSDNIGKSAGKSSRRTFLKSGAWLTGVASLGVLQGCLSGQGKEIPTDEARSPVGAWDKTFDVIIVGSGFSGMAAAIEARKAGASVLVIDKMPVFGGNSTINGGAIAVAGSPLQEKKGIKDSVELMIEDMLKAGRGLNHHGLLKVVAEGTRSAFDFTLEHGVEYKPFLQHFGGHSVPRTIQTKISSGAGIIRPLRASAENMGVVMRNRCKLLGFRKEGDRITGVQVRDGYRFPDESTGSIRHFRAKKAVIMCSGGFSRDLRFRMQQNPNLDTKLDSTNHPGATSEGLQAMFGIGATPVQINLIQLGPWSSPDEGGFGMVSQFNTIAAFPKGIMVDVRTGKRFVNELADRKARSEAILGRLDENGNPVYPISFCGEEAAKKAQSLPHALKYDVAWKFETLKEMADYFKMPYEGLKTQLETFNAAVKAGEDKEFGKPLGKAHIIKAPYYAVRTWPKVHYTMGGVAINETGQVLHMGSGDPIPGLYAAGECTGGPHGASRLGSCAVAETLVIGRIAGRTAATLG